MEREDGEMSDDNEMLVDDVKDEPKTVSSECTMLYKAGKDGLVIKQLEKVDASKLEERAKRFGLNLTGNRIVTQKQIDELYANCGIGSENERHFRFDTIHLNGIDGLTTKEIFQYLEDYKPISMEWIDDVSCNIVCQDHISAALALLVHSREIKNDEVEHMLAERSDHYWREGMPHPKKDLILMRFATNGDKKVKKKNNEPRKQTLSVEEYYAEQTDAISKNPWGDLCKSWGVYDHQEIFQRKQPRDDEDNDDVEDSEPIKRTQIKNKRLAMRLGKRRIDTEKHDEPDDSESDSEWNTKSKLPRMRMHADDEETKLRKKQAINQVPPKEIKKEGYPPLSIEVVNCSNYTKREATKLSDKFKYHNHVEKEKPKHSILSRLGEKVAALEENTSSDESSAENSEYNIMSKVHKVNSKARGPSSVWARLETKSESNAQADLRHMLKSKTKQKNPNDLRERLGKTKHSNLRIEIDNN